MTSCNVTVNQIYVIESLEIFLASADFMLCILFGGSFIQKYDTSVVILIIRCNLNIELCLFLTFLFFVFYC